MKSLITPDNMIDPSLKMLLKDLWPVVLLGITQNKSESPINIFSLEKMCPQIIWHKQMETQKGKNCIVTSTVTQ